MGSAKGASMLNKGDLVILRHAKIRGPDGALKDLTEAPDYGVIISLNVGHPATNEEICRVMWFDQETGARRGEKRTTLELIKDLKKISK